MTILGTLDDLVDLWEGKEGANYDQAVHGLAGKEVDERYADIFAILDRWDIQDIQFQELWTRYGPYPRVDELN